MSIYKAYADIDSTMFEDGPDENAGAQSVITHRVTYIGELKQSWYRGIGNFDLSALSGKTINKAKLVRHMTGITNGGQSAFIARVLNHPDTGGVADWTEAGVTWNDYDGTNAWTAGGGDFTATDAITYTEASASGPHEITGFKTLVDDAIANRGNVLSIITKLVDEDPGVSTVYNWWSKDNGSDIWHLEIDYDNGISSASLVAPRRSMKHLLVR